MNIATHLPALGLSLMVGLAAVLSPATPAVAAPAGSPAEAISGLRPPSVPLIAYDPYFSVWSPHDKLTDGATEHWTGKPQRMASLARVDGTAFRLMGAEPAGTAAMEQTDLKVWPTRTVYTFAGGGVRLTLSFITPLLPDDLDVASRPVTYLTWSAEATDGAEHDVSIYFDASAEFRGGPAGAGGAVGGRHERQAHDAPRRQRRPGGP